MIHPKINNAFYTTKMLVLFAALSVMTPFTKVEARLKPTPYTELGRPLYSEENTNLAPISFVCNGSYIEFSYLPYLAGLVIQNGETILHNEDFDFTNTTATFRTVNVGNVRFVTSRYRNPNNGNGEVVFTVVSFDRTNSGFYISECKDSNENIIIRMIPLMFYNVRNIREISTSRYRFNFDTNLDVTLDQVNCSGTSGAVKIGSITQVIPSPTPEVKTYEVNVNMQSRRSLNFVSCKIKLNMYNSYNEIIENVEIVNNIPDPW